MPVVGFAIAFERADKVSLGTIFETIAYSVDWREMVKEGV